MDKARLRRELEDRLAAIEPDERAHRSRAACERLMSTEQFQGASTVMLFLSLPYEVDTAEAILGAWQSGKTVAVPKVSWEQRHMMPVQINSLETGFSMTSSGLRNPTAGTPVPFGDIDLVVTPGLGFDRGGNRLGRGGAYYDRFFSHEELGALRCGFAFAEQVVDSIPVTDHDQPVDFLVTDEEVVYINPPQADR